MVRQSLPPRSSPTVLIMLSAPWPWVSISPGSTTMREASIVSPGREAAVQLGVRPDGHDAVPADRDGPIVEDAPLGIDRDDGAVRDEEIDVHVLAPLEVAATRPSVHYSRRACDGKHEAPADAGGECVRCLRRRVAAWFPWPLSASAVHLSIATRGIHELQRRSACSTSSSERIRGTPRLLLPNLLPFQVESRGYKGTRF